MYLYHHFEQITSNSNKSCEVELPCQGDNFNEECLGAKIRDDWGLSKMKKNLIIVSDQYRTEIYAEIRRLVDNRKWSLEIGEA